MIGAITVGLSFAITIGSVSIAAISGPVRQSPIPTPMRRNEINGVTTINILASQPASVAGAALGGIIIAKKCFDRRIRVRHVLLLCRNCQSLAHQTLNHLTKSSEARSKCRLRGISLFAYLPGAPRYNGGRLFCDIFGASAVLMPILRRIFSTLVREGLDCFSPHPR